MAQRTTMTIIEAVNALQDEKRAEAMFIAARWPNGIACPKCGSLDVYDCYERKPQPYRCRDCHRYFSVKTNSLMHGSTLSYSKWAMAMYLISTNPKGISSLRIARDVGVTKKTAWFLMHRIRRGWETEDQMFVGPVEVDEAYIAGKEKNRHAKKKLKSGNMAAKTVVVGILDRATNKIKTVVFNTPSSDNLVSFVHSNVEDEYNTPVYTDGAAAYTKLNTANHGVVEHSVGHYVSEDGVVYTNGIESFWSMIKRGVMGAYHYISPKHTHRYAVEFAGRHNDKDLDMIDQITSLMARMSGKRLTYRQLVGLRGHSLNVEHRSMTQAEAFRRLSSKDIERQRAHDHAEAQARETLTDILVDMGVIKPAPKGKPRHSDEHPLGLSAGKAMQRFFEENHPL